ncbi:energy transducer TonB [Flavobacterium sp. RS13.1]|uniref:energy transducer TonB n=1 Tax=Flavobacterium sp. RS13.1 TaxID=3400345 RepID=UPI003AB09F7D
MERNYKITIPKPCQENWDKMTPKDNGRFCMSCSKTVVDFTTMLPDEIQHFFIQNQNGSICGRFKKSQLDSITIQIPDRVLYSQTHYHKIFLLALFIAMGTTLFSCADKNGNKKKIDKIEVVDNTEQNQDEEVVSKCYGHEIESKKPKKIKHDNAITMGAIIPPNVSQTGNFKYHIIYNQTDLDVLPVPENGMKKFYKFFNKNYTASTKDKIAVLFVVEEDGSLSNFNIVNNTPKEAAEEAIRILKIGPKWIPGKRKNHIVRSSYTLSISL